MRREPGRHLRADRRGGEFARQHLPGAGGAGAGPGRIRPQFAQQTGGAGDIGIGPELAGAGEDVITRRGLDQPGGNQPRIIRAAEGEIARIAGRQHRHAKGHRLDHGESPALGPVQRHQHIGTAHQRGQITAGQGGVDQADAAVAGAAGIDPRPDRRLRRIMHPAAVMGLEDQPRRRVIGESRAKGGDRGQRVLALDERKTVEDRQRGEGPLPVGGG